MPTGEALAGVATVPLGTGGGSLPHDATAFRRQEAAMGQKDWSKTILRCTPHPLPEKQDNHSVVTTASALPTREQSATYWGRNRTWQAGSGL